LWGFILFNLFFVFFFGTVRAQQNAVDVDVANKVKTSLNAAKANGEKEQAATVFGKATKVSKYGRYSINIYISILVSTSIHLLN